jgi:ubiquinone/menaquinone biosynthesis C-methylase UbiE
MSLRTLRFFGSIDNNQEVSMLVTVAQRTVFNGTITAARQDFLFKVYDIPMDSIGSLPVTISIASGTLTWGPVLINYNRIPNPIYTSEVLTRFKSAVSWAEKIFIMSALAVPAFTQDQIKFLLSEDPAHWAAQNELLHQHGCGSTVIYSDSWRVVDSQLDGQLMKSGDTLHYELMIPNTPTVHDLGQDFQGAYILPQGTIDVLTKVVSVDQLNRPGIKILDIGTGAGQILQTLRDQRVNSEIHGMDIPNKADYYVLNSTYDQFIDADIRYPLPIPPDTYDVVVCSNVFMQSVMEMENDPALSAECLDEILKVLVPGGILVFNVDRLCWVDMDAKLNHLMDSQEISVLAQTWMYHRDRMYMFPPTRWCGCVTKIQR